MELFRDNMRSIHRENSKSFPSTDIQISPQLEDKAIQLN